MKTNLFFKLLSFVMCLLLVTYGCKEKDEASKVVPDKSKAKTTTELLAELASVKTQADAEKAVIHFWHVANKASRGKAYSESEYENNINFRNQINQLANAHLNFVTKKEIPKQTIGEIINIMTRNNLVKSMHGTSDPEIIIKYLQNKVNRALSMPEEPKNLLSVMIVADGIKLSNVSLINTKTILSPIQKFSLLMWLSNEQNSSESLLRSESQAREESANGFTWGEYGGYNNDETTECIGNLLNMCSCRYDLVLEANNCITYWSGNREMQDVCLEELTGKQAECDECENERQRLITECLKK